MIEKLLAHNSFVLILNVHKHVQCLCNKNNKSLCNFSYQLYD